MRTERFRLAILGLGTVLPFAVYLTTLAPDLTWAHNGADGGDLIVAAFTLGVPHPPGYPAYTLLAHLFSLIPLGSITYRVNLLSAVSAALATGVVALLALELTPRAEGRWVGALAAAFGFAFIPLVWEQAVIAEVYAPFAFWVALALLISQRVTRPRDAFALGLAWSIALGFHLTALLLLPLVLWSVWRARVGLRVGLVFAAGIFVASLQWLYPVWRAGRGAITWGDPTTLQGWWWLVSGALYRDNLFAVPFDAWLGRFAFFVHALLFGLGPMLCAIALVGWRAIVRQDRAWASALGITALAYIVFAIGYVSADSSVYLIPALMIFCLPIGVGVTSLLAVLRARFGSRVVIAGGIGLIVQIALTLGMNWYAVSLAEDRAAMRFGQQVCDDLPQAAVAITEDDRATFALWYFRFVLGQRPDTLIVDRDLLAFDWYQAQVGMTPIRLEQLVNQPEEGGRHPICWMDDKVESARLRCVWSK